MFTKLIISNVGSSPDTSLGAYGPRDVSGEEPPVSEINSYLGSQRTHNKCQSLHLSHEN